MREAFQGGQREVQMQSYPFRMTAENLARYRLDPNIGFWKELKEGSDNFEVTKQEVAVGVCDKHYVFDATPANGHFDPTGPCPQLKRDEEVSGLVAAKQSRDDAKVAELVGQGVRPVHTVYMDGGQNPYFASISAYASRPEALASAPIDVALDDGAIKAGGVRKGRVSPMVQVAAARTSPTASKSLAANGKVADGADVTGSIAGAAQRKRLKSPGCSPISSPQPADAATSAAPATQGATDAAPAQPTH